MAEVLTKDALKQVIDLAARAVEVKEAGNTPFVVISNDSKVVSLAEYVDNNRAERPIRKSGVVKVHNTGSFCEYYQLFSDPHSRVFADEINSRILAILDYHGIGENAPRWGQHRVDLTLRHSEEWNTWKGLDGKRTPQMEFAEFLEDNAPDIVSPSSATMCEVARDLRAKTEVEFGSALRMTNGAVQFKYSEQVKGTFGAGNVEVPESFTISIPVYLGCEKTSVTARLRYRINTGKLTFWYDLLYVEAIERDAFRGARAEIARALNVTIIDGTPA